MEKIKCEICGSAETENWCEKYGHCKKCDYVWLSKEYLVDPEAEKERYAQHENSAENHGYVKMFEEFLEKIGEIKNRKVLDFGCGQNPVLAELMRKKGAEITFYDKYFFAEKSYAQGGYDLITLTEVIEHLAHPLAILQELQGLLREGGKIALMTKLRTGDEAEFARWWYRRDVTHVSFFTLKSLEFLAKKVQMHVEFCDENDTIILAKN